MYWRNVIVLCNMLMQNLLAGYNEFCQKVITFHYTCNYCLLYFNQFIFVLIWFNRFWMVDKIQSKKVCIIIGGTEFQRFNIYNSIHVSWYLNEWLCVPFQIVTTTQHKHKKEFYPILPVSELREKYGWAFPSFQLKVLSEISQSSLSNT